MKRLWTLFINPIPRLIVGGVCFLIALLDGAMRQCEQSYEDFFQCLSFVGTWSCYIILFVIATFVVEFMLWPALKWIGHGLKWIANLVKI